MAEDQINLNLPDPPSDAPGSPPPGSPPPRRPIEPFASGDDEFDPANRSLASALRISFIALQLVMIVLVAMYFLSGWRQVPEQYRGLRLLFGRLQDAEPLDAGGYFVWPYPIGQFQLVPNSQQTVTLADEFWPALSAQQRSTVFSQLPPASKPALVPGQDGSVLTADHNVAHTSWNVQYRIVDAQQNQKTVPLNMNSTLVRRAVERGVVLGAAETTLDEIIQSRDRLSAKVKLYSQDFLDQIGSGIEITTATYDAYPPIPVQASYESVNQAYVVSAQQKVDAQRKANETLNAMAGPAHQQLRTLINEYDQLLAQAKADPSAQAQADAKLAEIDAMLVSDQVGGKVATIIGAARSGRGELIASYQGDLALFNAWIDRFETDPEVALTLLWGQTMLRISKQDFEWFSLPPGTKVLEILTNPNPERERRMKQEQYIKDVNTLE